MNRYLEELRIKQNTCSFNTAERDKTGRQASFNKERKEYGFDSRETWSLEYTSCEWLYCHLKMFLDQADKIVDLTYYSFTIPILCELPEDKCEYLEGDHYPTKHYYEEVRTVTQQEAINIIIEYLKYYLLNIESCDTGKEEKAMEMAMCSFKIYSIILPAMWW